MDSTLPLPEGAPEFPMDLGDAAATEASAEDRSLRLPVHGSTVTAAELRERIIQAADIDGVMEIDASQVESVGQAVLQILVAAHAEGERAGLPFRLVNPSQAFLDRVESCRLADAIGIETGDAL